MRRNAMLFCCILAAMSFLGCGRDDAPYIKKLEVNVGPAPELDFDRYEEVLFSIDTAHFEESLRAIQPDYMPFLAGDLSDPDAVQYLKDFAIDPFSLALYHKVKTHYPDLKKVQKLVSDVYGHFQYYYPQVALPKKIYTCVSGINPDIPPVMLADNALIISLDWYLDRDSIYDRIGMPKYRSERTGEMSLAKDLGELLWSSYLPDRHQQNTVLEEMVHEGQRLLFEEALCPEITDEVLLGYSKEQLLWAEKNEAELWADIVGTRRLYSSDYDMFRTFFADGPFTHEYSYDAPARLGEFLGLQIVRSYFGSHELSLQELLDNQDLQGIFQDSGYKPKK